MPWPVKKRSNGGFCEVCNKYFSELERHISTEQHTQFVTEQENWADAEQCIQASLS